MDAKKALDLVSQIVAVYKGTLKEHQVLQQAIKVLSDMIGSKTKELRK